MAIARAQHQPVIAEPDRTAVAVDGRVPDVEYGQMELSDRFARSGGTGRRPSWLGRVSILCRLKVQRINGHHLDR